MKKLNTYYIAEAPDNKQYNAAIVRKDNESILNINGFTALRFRYTKEGSLFVKLARAFATIKLAFSVRRNSLVLFQFPLLANAYKWLHKILKWREVKTVALIIDIDGIRDNNEILLKHELWILRRFDYIIDHNAAMTEQLQAYLPAAKIFSINLFDYPFTGRLPKRELTNSICFAGNISKSSFVYELNRVEGLRFNIYGPGYEHPQNRKEHITYKGVVDPYILPAVLEGSFGLVWDGSSIEKCDEYLRYNNPHKLSLYLAAGIPAIVWEHSAAAALVKENNIGICIYSLAEMPAAIKNLTAHEYETMQRSALAVGERVRKGEFLQKVIAELQDKEK